MTTDILKLRDAMTEIGREITPDEFGWLMVGIEFAIAAPTFWKRILDGTELATEHMSDIEQHRAAIQELYDDDTRE